MTLLAARFATYFSPRASTAIALGNDNPVSGPTMLRSGAALPIAPGA
ncbi:MAG TPA: hypothetical protein VGK84_03625 [Candidatus Tumulicola sp.]